MSNTTINIEKQIRDAIHEAMKPDASEYAIAKVQELLDRKAQMYIETFRAKINRIKEAA